MTATRGTGGTGSASQDAENAEIISVSKTLVDMRSNPRGDWTKDDIERACGQVGLICKNAKRGSHFKVRSDSLSTILTIPSRRPIKPVYIKQLVDLAERHLQAQLEKDGKR